MPLPRIRLWRWSGLLLSLGMLLGCFPKGDPDKPIPTALVPAAQQAQRLVVVLPGRGDDLAGLQRTGMAEAIQAAWPDADVVLTGLALGYYMQGQAPQRLHAEVIEPARARGYREIWLAGASLGGMGALMYDRSYPGEADGLILLAPYLGDAPLLREIAAAGGAARWDAGPAAAQVDVDNFQRELWRHVQGWARDPAKARNVWMAYGDRDRLREADAMLAPVLPPAQTLVRPGGHDWTVWRAATGEILTRIDATRPAK